MEPEIRPVEGFPLFGVSRDYRAWSRRKGDWHQLRLSRRSLKGSPTVILWREDGTTHARTLARLVADAFDSPPPPPPLPPNRREGIRPGGGAVSG